MPPYEAQAGAGPSVGPNVEVMGCAGSGVKGWSAADSLGPIPPRWDLCELPLLIYRHPLDILRWVSISGELQLILLTEADPEIP